MRNSKHFLPWAAVALAAVYLVVVMVPPGDAPAEFHLRGMGELPVVDRGRVQPLDTKARTALMIISGKQTFDEEIGSGPTMKKVRQPAMRWLMDVWVSTFNPYEPEHATGPALKHKVFRIENEEVLASLGLEARSGLRYSLEELLPKFREFMQTMELLDAKDPKKFNLFDTKRAELHQHFKVYLELSSLNAPHVIPLEKGNWLTLRDAMSRAGRELVEKHPAGEAYLDFLSYYHHQDVADFNRSLAKYRTWLERNFADEASVTSFETFFNHFAPFFQCAGLYVFVLVLVVLSWLLQSEDLRRSAFWLGVFTVVVHTWALVARMYIQDRPPVTNLYSSAVFIGWGCVLLGLGLEYIYRNGVGAIVGAVTGSMSLIVAHYLAMSGDTLEMMQAVLDTNFWLATHVTCITLGYTATFVAGFLGIAYVLLGPVSYLRKSGPIPVSAQQTLTRMIYGVVCFAMLLSFTGTVLGGIWADQSWGRFWGWDPKENGALLIVIWNALILHARWGGMAKARGIAVLAVLGNIVTAWSWFGVNMLGVGLHSYGFMGGAVFWLLFFMFTQLVIAAVGLLPPSIWYGGSPPNIRGLPPEPTGLPPLSGKKDAIMSVR